MADIYTHLRELSVGFFFFSEIKDLNKITPEYFLLVCKANIQNCNYLSINEIASNQIEFSKLELQVIKNGFNLAEKIKKIFDIQKMPNIIWLGLNTQSDDPIDLIINDIKFSLKEQSFILENMGLYKLINVLKGSNGNVKGLHIFEKFAPNELESWFKITRDKLIQYGGQPFEYKSLKYTSKGYLNEKDLILSYINEPLTLEKKLSGFHKYTYEQFKKETNSQLREKVFCKWIKQQVEKDKDYINAKRLCAIAAGKALTEYLIESKGNSPESLRRFFRIQDFEYYYAKTTNNELKIFKVPDKVSASKEIIVKDIYYKVPKSQLNFYTEIENTLTNLKIVFRSELRYSHGQLNGTPEAKLYIESGDLTTMYEKIF